MPHEAHQAGTELLQIAQVVPREVLDEPASAGKSSFSRGEGIDMPGELFSGEASDLHGAIKLHRNLHRLPGEVEFGRARIGCHGVKRAGCCQPCADRNPAHEGFAGRVNPIRCRGEHLASLANSANARGAVEQCGEQLAGGPQAERGIGDREGF